MQIPTCSYCSLPPSLPHPLYLSLSLSLSHSLFLPLSFSPPPPPLSPSPALPFSPPFPPTPLTQPPLSLHLSPHPVPLPSPLLLISDLSDNQLTGAPPLIFSSSQISNQPLATYSVRSNFFSGPYVNSPISGSSQPACPPTMQGSFAFSDLAEYAPTTGGSNARNCLAPGPGDCRGEPQRGKENCFGFCGLGTPSGVCGGHGTCYLRGGSSVPSCICDAGFYLSTDSAQGRGGRVTYPTCVSSKPGNVVRWLALSVAPLSRALPCSLVPEFLSDSPAFLPLT